MPLRSLWSGLSIKTFTRTMPLSGSSTGLIISIVPSTESLISEKKSRRFRPVSSRSLDRGTTERSREVYRIETTVITLASFDETYSDCSLNTRVITPSIGERIFRCSICASIRSNSDFLTRRSSFEAFHSARATLYSVSPRNTSWAVACPRS